MANLIGKELIFTYPNYGTPDGYPDYTAHSGQKVTVLDLVDENETDEDAEMYKIRAEDGWIGQAWRDELIDEPVRNEKCMDLLEVLAKMCHYAQSHCGDPDAWPTELAKRSDYFQCPSFVIACFLSQNTVDGSGGVEWEIVFDQLCDNKLDKNGMMCKSIDEWKKIIQPIVDDLGGWE